MARPLRVEYPGAWYHVMNRVAGHGLALQKSWTTDLFLRMLRELGHRFDVECHAYCVMGNHYHLLLHTPEGNLGRAMRHFNGLFTQQFNRRMHRDGPLFRGRYRAILVDADSYLLAVSRYIHRNPLEAGMVKRLDSYKSSSYPAYLGRTESPGWLKTDTVLDLLGSRSQEARYRAFVEERGEDDVSRFFASQRPGAILGSADFVKRALRSHKPGREQPKSQIQRRQPPLSEILEAVSSMFQVSTRDIRQATRGRAPRNIPRAAAMYLCQTLGQKKLTEIASHFGVTHYATVSVTIARLKRQLLVDRELGRRIEVLEEQLR